MPFSPRWLVHHGREADARKTLASLRDLPMDHELIELEFLEIKAQSLFEKRSTAEYFPHLADGSSWWVVHSVGFSTTHSNNVLQEHHQITVHCCWFALQNNADVQTRRPRDCHNVLSAMDRCGQHRACRDTTRH